MSRLPVSRTLPDLRRRLSRYRASGQTIALVPTMGALHDGHLALVRAARRRADRVVVSVFVNPAQFAPTEDFGSYPRTFASDRSALAAEKADLIWAPTIGVMYPAGFATQVVPGGVAAAGLEDRVRPHFFAGMATVVAKLFLQCHPDIAVFGEKDYQQLRTVTALARDLDMPVKVVGIPTVREDDGLAMSSRNAYLTPSERTRAPLLYEVLRTCAAAIAAGTPIGRALAKGRRRIAAGGFVLDYLEARHAETLRPIRPREDAPVRLLVAARLGATRLIDNIAV